MHLRDNAKRHLRVVDAEDEDGNTEYKRQVHKLSTNRLRTLATQMSYRLDQGSGRCTYHIGVEDDGCHSILDYPAVSESAWVLESIARSLNSIVVERKMIQNEVMDDDATGAVRLVSTGTGGGGEEGGDEEEGCVVVVNEPPVLGRTCAGMYNYDGVEDHDVNAVDGEDDADEKEEKTADRLSTSEGNSRKKKLCTEEGAYTRCTLTIQRVETHLLDPSPLSLSALSVSSSRSASFGGEGTEVDVKKGEDDTRRLPGLESSSGNEEKTADSPLPVALPSSSCDSLKSEIVSIEETLSSRNVRVAVVGNVDAGKSTLIGTLTTSSLDDGRGSSRTAIMKHRHEIESGRTSTATSHLLGFQKNGETIAGRDRIRANKVKTEDEVARQSYSIVTLMDLAGHEKYLKTTIHGVSSGMADYGLILVNSRHPPTHMTTHHLNLCCSFGIPVIVVFTKVDGCPDHALATSKKEMAKLLRSPEIGKRPFAIKKEEDIATCSGKFHALAPMIEVSCVTGEGLDLLRKMLFTLPKRRRHEKKVDRPFEFLVEDIFNVPGVGSVVSGFVNAGELAVGAHPAVYVGPTDDGSFLRTNVKSSHVARINTQRVTAGQSACLAFSLSKDLRKKLRRGMVVLTENPTSTKEFDAEICVLKGEGTTIRKSYQAFVHILNVRQSAFARKIEVVNNHAVGLPPSHGATVADDDDNDGPESAELGGSRGLGGGDGIVLRPGSRAKVRFQFAQRPEYIRPGMRMLFRDGRVRGVGIITGIPPAVVAP